MPRLPKICRFSLLLSACVLSMAAFGQGSLANRAEALNKQAAKLWETDPFKALALAQQAQRLADSLQNKRAQFYALRTQAICRVALGQLQEGELLITKGLAIARVLEQDSLIAAGLGTQGYIQMNRGDAKAAAKTLESALSINSRMHRAREAERNRLNLGIVNYYMLGRADSGLGMITHAMQWAEANEDWQLLNNTLSNLASIRFGEGKKAEALALNARSRQVNAKTGSTGELVFALNQAARFELDMGQPRIAQARIAEALAKITHTDLAPAKACTYKTAADVYEQLGNTQQALTLLRRSHTLYDSLEEARQAHLMELSEKTMKAERERAENQQLRMVRARQKESISQQRLIIALGGLVLAMLVILLVVLGRSNAKVRMLLGRLKEQHGAILEQKEKIEILNASLEATLAERTDKLDRRSRQILEYASYNSHIIRGPLARILGLAFLLQHAENDEDARIYTRKMEESAKEMDQAIQTVNRKLELEELADYIPASAGRRL